MSLLHENSQSEPTLKRPGITCVDLFCGVGGLTHGLVRGGVHVAAGEDLDSNCRFPYEANNKARFIQADIREISGDVVRGLWRNSRNDACTLLAGCAPCQSFSTYSRKGRPARDDTRWDLLADFGRLVFESRPDLVTMENVPQLLDHQIFPKFLAALAGYQVWWDVLECSKYGVPQSRKRLVLMGSRLRNAPLGIAPLTVPTTLPVVHEINSVRNAISHLRPLAAGEFDPADSVHSACSLSPLNLLRIRASKPGGTWRDWAPELVAACHQKTTGSTYPGVYGRMEWDAPAPTITTQSFGYGNGRFGHPDQDRAISLREAAILQTFPDSYRFVAEGEKARFSVLGRLIGNAVPVRIGEIVADSFFGHLRQASSEPGHLGAFAS